MAHRYLVLDTTPPNWEEGDIGPNRVRCIYRVANRELFRFKDWDKLTADSNPSKATDLLGMCKLLMHRAKPMSHSRPGGLGPMEQKCILVITFLAVGWSGETRYVRWATTEWDPLFESPHFMWSQLKTLKQQCMMFASDFQYFKCDIFHCFACFLFSSTVSFTTQILFFTSFRRFGRDRKKLLQEYLQHW